MQRAIRRYLKNNHTWDVKEHWMIELVPVLPLRQILVLSLNILIKPIVPEEEKQRASFCFSQEYCIQIGSVI